MATRAGKIHEMLAAHHATAHAEHKKAMEGFTKGSPAHDFHKNMAEHHAGQKEDHLAELADCQKSERDQLAKRDQTVEPTRVSVVAPDRPRAVLRPGQPQIPVGSGVDLTKVIGVNETDMHGEEPSLRP